MSVSTPLGGATPVSTSLPPAGAGAGGTGGGVGGAPAAALLALAGLWLLSALLPGLLGLEIFPWRSALCALRLERPG